MADTQAPVFAPTVTDEQLRAAYLSAFQARGNLGPLVLGSQVVPTVDLTSLAAGGPTATFEELYSTPSLSLDDISASRDNGPPKTASSGTYTPGVWWIALSFNLKAVASQSIRAEYAVGGRRFVLSASNDLNSFANWGPFLLEIEDNKPWTITTLRDSGTGNVDLSWVHVRRQLIAL